jgi:hypothetical protein
VRSNRIEPAKTTISSVRVQAKATAVRKWTARLRSNRFTGGFMEIEIRKRAPMLLQLEGSRLGRPGDGYVMFSMIGKLSNYAKSDTIDYMERGKI